MPPTFKATIGLYGVGALAFGAGIINPPLLCTPKGEVRAAVPAVPRPVASVQPPRAMIPIRVEATVPPAWAATSLAAPARRPAVVAVGRDDGTAQRAVFKPRAGVASQAYQAMVKRIARRYAVEWRLVMAIIDSESGGDPSAVSAAGAVGLMQLMPETAADLGVDPWDPEQNVEGAVRYLSALLSTFGSVDLSLIAYNAGPGFAQRYRDGAVELGAETRAFLIRVGTLVE